MAELFSRYESGLQWTAGAMTGSVLGVSGLNPIVDRLNSITDADGSYSNLSVGAGIDITAGSVISAETATATNPGVVELATATEVSTGTDNTRAVTALGLATSDPPRILENRTSDPSSTTGRIWIRTDL